jgi:hypothetical protein
MYKQVATFRSILAHHLGSYKTLASRSASRFVDQGSAHRELDGRGLSLGQPALSHGLQYKP